MRVEYRHIVGENKIELVVSLPDWIERPIVWIVILYRRVRYGYAFRRIKLNKGKYAIVDVKNYRRLAQYKWYAQKGGYTYYAARNIYRGPGAKPKCILMHREIIMVGKGLVVDHINRNGLDNREANVRPATFSENNYNRRKPTKNTSSKYRGVYRHRGKKWRAMIKVNKKNLHIGSFDDELEAARAYDKAAREYHGKFATVNFGSGWT